MKTLMIVILLGTVLAAAAAAQNPTYYSAVSGVVNNSTTDSRLSGNPALNRIAAPIPVIPMPFRVSKPIKVYIVVEVAGNSNDADLKKAQGTLTTQLQSWALACKLDVQPVGTVPGCGYRNCLVYTARPIITVGQSTSRSDEGSTTSWSTDSRGYNYPSSYNRTDSSSSGNWSQVTYVVNNMTADLTYYDSCGNPTVVASEDRIPSGNIETTGRGSYSNWDHASNSNCRRWGSDASRETGYRRDEFYGDANFSAAQSKIVTLEEAADKMTRVLLADGSLFFNIRIAPKLQSGSTTCSQIVTVVETEGEGRANAGGSGVVPQIQPAIEGTYSFDSTW